MDYFVLAGKSESDAAATLRALGRESVARNELFAANQLLVLELSCLDALDQARRVIRSQLDSLFTLLGEVLKPLSAPEIDELVQSYAAGSRLELQALLILLSRHDGGVSESAWSWLLGVALGADGEFHGLAFRALEAIDRVRFGRILLARGWAWSPNLDQRVNHIGSGALIAAAGGLPLERMSSRIAPWRLLEAASAWGNDPNDVRLAAGILTAVLTDHRQEAPDTGSTLTVEHVMGQSGPMPVSIEPNDADPSEVDNGKANGPVVVADSDRDAERYERAARVAQERIANALKSGASLLVVQIESGDFEPAIQHAPDHVDRWLEGLDGVTPDFARRLRVAQPAFLALCEALLRVDDARGPQLWNALRQLSSMRVLGEAGIEELVHILFRVRETERVRALRMQLLELDDCNTDLALFSIALAAEINGQRVWLEEIIQEDDASAIQWRRMRATVLRGFRSGNSLPVGDAWPDDKIRTRREHLKVSSAQWQFREACAKHWWNTYWHAPDDTSAYAAWVMLLRSVDRRAWCWILNEFPTEAEGLPLYRVKAAHLRLNIHSLRRAMEKREEKLKKQFLTRDIVNGAGPWGSHN